MEEALNLLSRVQSIVAQEKSQVEKVRQSVEDELLEARRALEAEKVALAHERRASRVQMDQNKERVKLNVGGVLYETTLSTLRKEESFLSALFSGRYEVAVDEKDGSVFIDRDGVVFRHILNYLRRGRLVISESDTTLTAELLDEARFFQISSLVALLQPKKVALPMTDSNCGLFHWLGTNGLSREWTNPATMGLVRIRSSRSMSGAPEGIVAKNQVAGGICKVGFCLFFFFFLVLGLIWFFSFICKDARGQWVEIDIGKDRLMNVSHYSLRPGQCCRMGNWMLQGSENREEWQTLSMHVDEFWEGNFKVTIFAYIYVCVFLNVLKSVLATSKIGESKILSMVQNVWKWPRCRVRVVLLLAFFVLGAVWRLENLQKKGTKREKS
jgi:hypothetical protein